MHQPLAFGHMVQSSTIMGCLSHTITGTAANLPGDHARKIIEFHGHKHLTKNVKK